MLWGFSFQSFERAVECFVLILAPHAEILLKNNKQHRLVGGHTISNIAYGQQGQEISESLKAQQKIQAHALFFHPKKSTDKERTIPCCS